ncbi:MAG: hypothetical protein DLM58_09660 [Pseudonocardiales bacterium]|nr:MAG: hypothetical protein DLM58_09660 [Pseudonocardiales bacterium]
MKEYCVTLHDLKDNGGGKRSDLSLDIRPHAFGGKGRAAITLGNPDTATHLAICVPGLDQKVDGYMGNTDAVLLSRDAER